MFKRNRERFARLNAMVDALAVYATHGKTCHAPFCAYVAPDGWPCLESEGHRVHGSGSHPFVPGPCSCGLAVLIDDVRER